MIRFLMPLLSGVLVAGLASAAPLTIDNFTNGTPRLESGNDTTVSYESTNDGSFVGTSGTSKRTLDLTGYGNVPPEINYVAAQVTGTADSNPRFSFAAPEDAGGEVSLTYSKIGGWDFNGYLGFLFTDLRADHPFDYTVTMFDTGSKSSTASGTFSLPESISTDVLLSFSSFTGDVDLGAIDKLVFMLKSDGMGLDFSMSQISAAIPIPAAGFFLVTALAGLGLLRSRKMAEAA